MSELIPLMTLVLLGALVIVCLILAFRLPRRNTEPLADTKAEMAVLQERISSREVDLLNHKQLVEDSYKKLSLEQASSLVLREKISTSKPCWQQERMQHQDKLALFQNAHNQMNLEVQKARNR